MATPTGKRQIEELKPNEHVLAYHSEEKSVVERRVLHCHSREVDEIYELRIGDEIIRVTAEHPFYVVGPGWTRVADLTKGDMFMTRDGQPIELGGITRVARRVRVYNLTVEGDENYFVGTNEVLVHNKPGW